MRRALLAALVLCACTPPQETPPLLPIESGWRIDPDADLNALFDCLAERKATLVVAHRGGPAARFPENALATFENTLHAAPALIEVDIAASADGVHFLLHDETLERTTEGAGEAKTLLWADIEKLRLKDPDGAPTPYTAPTLEETLRWAEGRTILKLDLKRSASYETVAALVKETRAETRVILIAYTLPQAQKLHRLLPETMISLNIGAMAELNAAIAGGIPAERLIGFTGLEAPDPRLIAFLAQRGVEADFGTLGQGGVDREIARSGEEARYAEIASMGVDLLSTDRPVAAHKALEAAGRAPTNGACGVARS